MVLQYSTDWAMKTSTLGAGQFIEFNLTPALKKNISNTSSALSSFGAITLLFEAKQ